MWTISQNDAKHVCLHTKAFPYGWPLKFRVVRATCGSLVKQAFMWVAESRLVQVSIAVELSGERTQYSIVGG